MARLDAVMVQQGMVPSRQRAKTLIQNGQISVNGKVCTKPAFAVSETDRIAMEGSDIPFVGRGGLKLEHAVQQMQLSLEGMVCLDIGASTGGFTDCMLQHGAAKVYAIDVGHGQLVQSLRGKLGGNRRSQHCTGTAETAGGFLFGGRVFHLAAPCAALRAAAAADRGTGRGAHQAPV